jgi:hypothetical protein
LSVAFRLAIIVCAAIALTGCGRSASYRYKLTLSLDTPDGVKTGFNVVQIDYWTVSVPAQGEPHKTRGQGLYLDLGPGRKPLIALLTHIRRANERPDEIRWLEDDPIRIMARLCLNVTAIYSWVDVASKFASCKTPFAITPADLPDLVTFVDVNSPNSVLLVDPNNLAATLGPGVAWRSMTLQATDEPLTKGMEEHLAWLKGHESNIQLPSINSFEYGNDTFINTRNFESKD